MSKEREEEINKFRKFKKAQKRTIARCSSLQGSHWSFYRIQSFARFF